MSKASQTLFAKLSVSCVSDAIHFENSLQAKDGMLSPERTLADMQEGASPHTVQLNRCTEVSARLDNLFTVA